MNLDLLVSDCLGPNFVPGSPSSVPVGKLLSLAVLFSLVKQRYLGALHCSTRKAWKQRSHLESSSGLL